ncbi:MAG: iron-containing alcohol dehydrogenase, partial [Gammaproteobacteria bacterium]|nr:iron-containing alcohol dehydrogenase [Gammaproteobacteria bacterium]MCW8927864.1 iron-containing alcohol dehydrogenase [Gammaproteobacteria bacterium]
MEFSPFSTVTIPRIRFGAGTLSELPALVAEYSERFLLLTGGNSFVQSDYWPRLKDALLEQGIVFAHSTIEGEPSPQRVDELVTRYHNE